MKKTVRIISLILAMTLLLAMPMPSFAASKHQPIVILKFDDFTEGNLANFALLYDILKENDIVGGFGIIGKTLENIDPSSEFCQKTIEWHDAGIEIWHHGYSHSEPEYHGSDYASQRDSFAKTLDLTKEKCGIEITSFGSPYNNCDETTVKVINECFPQIRALMFVADPAHEALQTNITTRVNIEPTTGVVSYDGFVESYEANKRADAIVLQGHAGAWKDSDREDFKKVIAYLKEKESVFMTPTQYADYTLEKADEEPPIEVTVRGEYVDFDDVVPTEINDRVLVPFRKIFSVLGAEIDWDGDTGIATATKGDVTIKISEQTTAYINDEPIELDVAAMLIDDRFMVPIRFVSESFDNIVYWDDANKTVVIADKPERKEPLPEGAVAIKDCTFSKFFEDEMGYFSYDGDRDTLWSCDGTKEWVCYDLGEKTDVNKVSILWNKADQRKAKFKIEVSDDAENFTVLFEGEACGNTTDFEDYAVEGSGRYVRIFCMGNDGSYWNAIKEINIYK